MEGSREATTPSEVTTRALTASAELGRTVTGRKTPSVRPIHLAKARPKMQPRDLRPAKAMLD
eukprot:2493362-Pyramimonas_sp.AAC.1